MPSPYTLSDNDLLTIGAQAIENSLSSPDLLEAVTPYGYDPAAFQEGRDLLSTYDASVQVQRHESGERKRASDVLNDAWDAFHEHTYMPNVAVARILFERGTQTLLGITGRRPRSFNAYLQEARGFYNTILADADLQAEMAAHSVTRERLLEGQAEVEALERLNQAQEREKTEAQNATRRRNDERRAFADWLSRYQKFAHLALRDRPDLTEQLGLTAPS